MPLSNANSEAESPKEYAVRMARLSVVPDQACNPPPDEARGGTNMGEGGLQCRMLHGTEGRCRAQEGAVERAIVI